MKTLEQILKEEQANRHEHGIFGITACKESIKWWCNYKHITYYTYLGDLVERANNELGFNSAMVLACWELINGK